MICAKCKASIPGHPMDNPNSMDLCSVCKEKAKRNQNQGKGQSSRTNKYNTTDYRKSLPALIQLIFIVVVYIKYSYDTVFRGVSLHINTLPPPDGPGFIMGFWPLIKFFVIYGGPFAFTAFYFEEWSLKHAGTVSMIIWGAIFFYFSTFYSAEFSKLYPGGTYCLIVGITTYPPIGISLLTGHFAGKYLTVFKKNSSV